ncbi:MAG: hypothetical protein AAF447_00900 [Myxococcota bacterium]
MANARGRRRGRIAAVLLCVAACSSSKEAGTGTDEAAGSGPSWLGAAVAVVFFDGETGREVPAGWAGLDRALRAQPGFRQHLLFGGQQAEHPYVSFAVFEDRPGLSAALERPALKDQLVRDVAAGIYELAARRGDVREPGAAVALVPVQASASHMEAGFPAAADWLRQREGFVGALLLRRRAGDTAPFVLVARWTSPEALAGVTADQDFPLHARGVEGVLGTYVPVNP